MKHLRIVLRGIAFLGIPITIGVGIVIYVPSVWIGWGAMVMLGGLIYITGATVTWPWSRT